MNALILSLNKNPIYVGQKQVVYLGPSTFFETVTSILAILGFLKSIEHQLVRLNLNLYYWNSAKS